MHVVHWYRCTPPSVRSWQGLELMVRGLGGRLVDWEAVARRTEALFNATEVWHCYDEVHGRS